MLKEAKKKIKDVNYVLFDSWFCFNCFIKQVRSLGIEVICQLKNMPGTNKYSYNGKDYSLKEQMSNLDSIIASDALVFLRYSILTYLSFKENHRFYEVLEKNRNNRKIITYGMRLLQYFVNKFKYIIDIVCELIQENKNDEAINILRKLTFNGQEFQIKCVDLK